MRSKKTSDSEWKAILSPAQFRVCREAGTERPFSGALNDEKRAGVYRCVCCQTPLFSSDDKFNSGTGWPSFTQAINKEAIAEFTDGSLGMQRVEVRCEQCDAHLGHVFPDGPEPTGMRYCINSIALDFKPD